MKILKKNSSVFSKLAPILVLILIISGFFWRVFLFKEVPLPGDFIVGVYYPWFDYKWGTSAGVPVKNPITTDVVSLIYPEQILSANLFKIKTWPLWNPYILTGTPLLANFQSAPLSPTRIVYFLFNNITGWSIEIILQFVLAGVFTYFLLRWWKLSKFASIFGGIAYAFSGYNLIFSEWNGHTLAAAFIPLVILFADRLLAKRNYWDGFWLSVAIALQLFSGYTLTSVYTAIAIGLLYFVRIVGDKKWFIKTLVLGIFCFLGILLSAIQIIPGLELIKNSQRAFEPHPFEWTFLPWKKTITFIAPDYFGNHATGNYWGPQDYTSNTGFVGVVVLTLAVVATLTLFKKREVKFLLLLAIVALVLSYPDPFSIFLWSKNILGMQANSADRATQLFCAALCFLAAFGLEAFMVRASKFRIKFLSLFPSYLLLSTFALFAIFLYKNNIGFKNLIFPIIVLLGATIALILPRKISKYLLFGLLIIELFRFGWKFEPISPSQYTYPTTPVLQFLQKQEKPFRTTGAKVIPSNLRMAYQIESTEGYETFHPLNVSEFITAINSGNVNSLPVGRYGIVDNDISPLLDLANTKYYLALTGDEKRFTDNPKRFVKVFSDKSVDIFESKTVLPRAFMVYEWNVDLPKSDNDLTSLNELLQPDFSLGKHIILDSSPNLTSNFGVNRNIKVTSNVNYKDYENQQSVIDVNTSTDGMLFISDAYYPGWKAFIDGKETKIYKADFAFRAIEVPKGKHEVKMVYQPDSFYTGMKITIATFIILAIIGVSSSIWLRKHS